MEYRVKLRISNRHVHLNKETYDKLFDHELTFKNKLNQIGNFSANECVSIIVGDKRIDNVRIVGPLRSYNQIEISMRDARMLGINPPVRKSGDVTGTPKCILETNKGRVETEGVIIADRHIHMNESDAEKYGVVNNQVLKVKIDGPKSGIVDANVKISSDGYFEAHLDTDDGNAFLINDNDEGTLIIE